MGYAALAEAQYYLYLLFLCKLCLSSMPISAIWAAGTSSFPQDRTSYHPVAYSVALTTSATVPATITQGSIAVTTNIVTVSIVQVPTTSYSLVVATPTTALSNSTRSICAGDGLDSMSIGVLSTIVFSVVVGGLIWVYYVLSLTRGTAYKVLYYRRHSLF